MKKRSAEILRRLVDAPSKRLRLDTLMSDYRISEKTLRSDISSIMEFALDPAGGSLVRVTDAHVSLAPNVDPEDVCELLDAMDLYDYRLSLDERVGLIVIELLTLDEGQWLSMQALANLMYVTRNTVMADCKLVDSYLKRYDVELVSKSKLGMRIEVSGDARREILIDLFAGILSSRRCRHDYYSSLIAGQLGFAFTIDDVLDPIHRYLRVHNFALTLEVERELAAGLYVLLGAPDVQGGDFGYSSFTSDASIVTPVALDAVGKLVEEVARVLGLGNMAPEHIAAIERVILRRDLNPQIKQFDDFELYCAISHFLLLVGRDLDIEIQGDDLLVESLLSHIKSVTDWSADAFEFTPIGPSGAMVGMVQAASEPHFSILEDYLHRPMDASMRASIVVHICAALYRSESSSRSCNVLIACPSSVATSKYLEAQVKNYFNLNVVGVVRTGELERGEPQDENVDFIISTVAIDRAPLPVVVVSPVLSIDDINLIQAQAFRQSRVESPSQVVGPSIISRLCDIYAQGNKRKVSYLNGVLARVLEEVESIEEESIHASPLLSMLQKKYIRVESGTIDWRSGIRMASEFLMRDGCFTQGYVDKAISNVEEYGSYIIVNQGIALAHAAHGDGASRDSLGLLVAKDGVVFDDDERVFLLFFFSQVDDTDFLELFREIISLGNDQAGLIRMRSVPNAADAYQFLLEMLTEYVDRG